MSDSDLKSQDPASTGAVPDANFFHSNLHYREVLATLRYGIEARKGLILLSGDAGTGKSTLIRRLTQELHAGVTCIVESDSGVNFTDLLRLILRHLHGEENAPDPSSMVDRCKAMLRAQRDRGHIVCLIIDNAHQLDELTLEYLMETFFPADSRDRDNRLLQVVLAGRPPIREKLLHPWLRPLNPQLGLLCHVEPLEEKDVASYVEDQLQAWRLPPDLLEQDATRRIADYTNGNPRLIHDLCAHAVELAQESPTRRITADSIAAAARDLGLSEAWRSRKTNNVRMDFPRERKERDEAFDFEASEAHTTDMLIQTFLQDTPPRRRRWFAAGGRLGTGMRVLLPLLLIVAVATWMQRDAVIQHVANWAEEMKAISAWPMFSATKQPEAARGAPTETATAPVAPPRADDFARQDNDTVANKTPPYQRDKSEERSVLPADNFTPTDSKPSAKPSPALRSKKEQASRPEPPEIRNKAMEAQIEKAIQNRAISGVDVSVINGTAVLQGRVATERQKQAAERAASSVSGVERVRNRIRVD
jgi:general secretion pathway protein A